MLLFDIIQLSSEIFFRISDTEIIACRHIVIAIMFYLIHATPNYPISSQPFNDQEHSYLLIQVLIRTYRLIS